MQILRQVLLNLSIPDLMSCSEVNRNWNYETRTLLRDLRKVTAVNKGDRPCYALRCLDSDLSRMTVNPYTGLCLNIPNHPASLCTKTTANYNFLLDQMPLKRLKINWEWSNKTESRCPVVKFISKVLSKHASQLEELIFQQLPLDRTPLKFKLESLPKLKIVRFPECLGGEHVPVGFASYLIDCAPALEVLDLEFCATGLRSLQQNGVPLDRLHVIKNLRFYPHPSSTEEIRKFALTSPQLEKFTVYAPGPGRENVSAAWDAIRLLFQSSATSLKWLKIDSTVLAMFRSMGIPALENLETLTIGMAPGNYTDREILKEIYCLDFTWYFPKILSVTVFEISGPVRRSPPLLDIPDLSDDDDSDDDDDYDFNRICHLRAEDSSQSAAILRLALMFPNVTTFSVSSSAMFVYIDLWKVWPRLRTLDVTQTVYDLDVNLDALFCGISPEELNWLKEQADDFDDEDEFFNNVNIVPIRPGLYCMKGEVFEKKSFSVLVSTFINLLLFM